MHKGFHAHNNTTQKGAVMSYYDTEYDPWEEGDIEDESEQYEELDDYDQYLEEHDREMNQWIGWEIKR
jgi:hypothetical protein